MGDLYLHAGINTFSLMRIGRCSPMTNIPSQSENKLPVWLSRLAREVTSAPTQVFANNPCYQNRSAIHHAPHKPRLANPDADKRSRGFEVHGRPAA